MKLLPALLMSGLFGIILVFGDIKSSIRVADAATLLVVIIGLISLLTRNSDKKASFFLFILCGIGNIYHRQWYDERSRRFFFLAGSIFVCLILLFFVYENLVKAVNKGCSSKQDKLWIRFENDQSKKSIAVLIYDDLKNWLFLDNEQYRNITSVKSKLLLRTLHYFTLMTFVILSSVLLFNVKNVASEKLLILIPSFFVIYSYLGTQHWNQWKYCADLYNSLKPSDTEYQYKRYCLLLDLMTLDMWANKAFQGFFKHAVQELLAKNDQAIETVKERTQVSFSKAWEAATRAQELALADLRQKEELQNPSHNLYCNCG